MEEILKKMKKYYKTLPREMKIFIIILPLFLFTILLLKKIMIGDIGNNNIKDKFTQNNNNGIVINKSNNTTLVERQINIDTQINNINQEGIEEEEFKVKIQRISGNFLEHNIIFYKDKNCNRNYKIDSSYNKNEKIYSFLIEMRKKEIKTISVNKEGFKCRKFIIKQTEQILNEPIRLELDCDIIENKNFSECREL